MKIRQVLMAGIFGLVVSSQGIVVGEHPHEHPSEHPKASKAEHPSEHPKKAKSGYEHASRKARSGVSIKDLAKAIERYVAEDSQLKGGRFLVYDTVDKKMLSLRLTKVHKKRLAKVSDGVYFACADFKADDGTIYDLDIFMKGHSAKTLKTTEVTVHKKAGKARYGWVEKKGIWSKKKL